MQPLKPQNPQKSQNSQRTLEPLSWATTGIAHARGLALRLALPLALLGLAPTAHAFCGFYAGKADANLFNHASQVVVVRDGTPDELRSAGVSWATAVGQAQPVVLTRLHVRYTANTFPEDLVFTQTKDRQNWQARYVVQNPYGGSVAQCSDKVGQMDCEAMCKPRVAQQLGAPDYEGGPSLFRNKDRLTLQRDCVSACVAAKQAGMAQASRYYQTELPQRIAAEKQTLAQLTGWTLAKIDAMPGAQKFLNADGAEVPSRAPQAATTWWEELFAPKKVKP